MSLRIAQSLDLRGRATAEIEAHARSALSAAPPGALIEVLSTDRGALLGLSAWCATEGIDLLESSELGGVSRVVYRRRASG